MPVQDPTDHKPTLGQRIDAMLGPLDTEAQAFREAITSGRAQMAQMQARIDRAEQALAGIEGKMVQVLQSLAAEEPMLALAMSAGDLPESSVVNEAGAAAVPEHVAPEPTRPEPTPPLPTPVQAAEPEPASPQSPAIVTLEMAEESQEPELPTPEQDTQAVGEILDLLDAGMPDPQTSEPSHGSLADAAALADEVTRSLGGIGE